MQKIVVERITGRYDGESIGKYLTEISSEGWRIREITTPCYRAGGYGGNIRSEGFYYDCLFILLDKTEKPYQYCTAPYAPSFKRASTKKYLDDMNKGIEEKNKEGYDLITIIHLTAIAAEKQSNIDGTGLHLLVFERQAASDLENPEKE